MERCGVEFANEKYLFDLDLRTKKWTEGEPESHPALDEGDFPLIVFAGGKRYELYSDGTFEQAELA